MGGRGSRLLALGLSDFTVVETALVIIVFLFSLFTSIYISSRILVYSLFSVIGSVLAGGSPSSGLLERVLGLIPGGYGAAFTVWGPLLIIVNSLSASIFSLLYSLRVSSSWPSVLFTLGVSPREAVVIGVAGSLFLSSPIILLGLSPLIFVLNQNLFVLEALYASVLLVVTASVVAVSTFLLVIATQRAYTPIISSLLLSLIISFINIKLIYKLFVDIIYLFIIFIIVWYRMRVSLG